MSFWHSLVAETQVLRVAPILGALLAAYVLVRFVAHRHVRRLRAPLGATVLYLLLVPVAGYLRHTHSSFLNDTRLVALSLGTLAVVWESGTLVFGALDIRLRFRIPRIVSDLIVATVSIVAVFVLASRMGIDLSSLLATSAVLTAVVGLSLQDTLGNMVAGITLQLDSSIRVGDWIKVGDLSGKVSEIRWRFTAIETRNWETILIPNAQLVRGQVVVLGRRTGEATQWRRWVYFNVDFRFSPTQVIDAVQSALRGEPIHNVAEAPAPNCVLIDICDSYYRFAVRYWLLDLAVDDPTDSVVRTRVASALKRLDVPLSIPARAVFVTTDTTERREKKVRQDLERRVQWLQRIELFKSLSPDELNRLAAALHAIPFAPDEVLTRQGAEAHWLYMIVSGRTSVRVRHEDMEREVAQLGAGQYFGEMGLLTGEARTATVVALEEVECYRLGKQVFEELVVERPEIATEVASELARRRVELMAAREDLDAEARRERERQTARDLVRRMRAFFGLEAAS
ncbi:MAG: mechanosensitive ion channel [Polyangiaceae bacterium]|nr:mechanosensitive ion channel [Polyangiaceae bacterium]